MLARMSVRLMVSTPDTKCRLRARHANGEVQRLRRGIYTDGPGDSLIEEVAAAVVRMDAVASHETAAALWGIPTLGRVQQVQVTRARRCQGATHEYEGVVLYHARLDPDHLTVHKGVPITNTRAHRDGRRAKPVVPCRGGRRRCSTADEQLLP